ncbi:MAG: hypothetical protein ACR2IK_23045 [Chloroflexota bacterium]
MQVQAANLRLELWHLQGVQDDPNARKLLFPSVWAAVTGRLQRLLLLGHRSRPELAI